MDGSLVFLAPLALIGFIVLPAIWLLTRLTPPRPQIFPFPPLKILLGAAPKEEEAAKTPWWVLALRLMLASCVILAMAGPLWRPQQAVFGDPHAPLLILIDDGWAAALDWSKRIAFAQTIIEGSGAGSDGLIAIAPMSQISQGRRSLEAVPAPRAMENLRALQPQPFLPDRLLAWPTVGDFLHANPASRILWLNDGLEMAGARAFGEKLSAIAGDRLRIAQGDRAVLALAGPRNETDALILRALRDRPISATAASAPIMARVLDGKGLALAETLVQFSGESLETAIKIDAPVELRNQIARVEIVGARSAGAVSLIDARSRRRRVALISGASADVSQPLLAPNYYLAKAIAPYADVWRPAVNEKSPIAAALENGANVLILSDMALAPGADRDKLEAFLQKGGVVIRFAGSRLAGSGDDLTPVALRRSGRILGGALSWEHPKQLAPFDQTSPFYGLTAPEEATVSRQVLAEPSPGLTERTWAQLADHTPLVTAEARGKGLLVLFHITADTTWSNLPISGLFPQMLNIIIDKAGESEAAARSNDDKSGVGRTAAPPVRLLNGFGALEPPTPVARALPSDYQAPPNAEHPPGFYGSMEAPIALNALPANATVSAVDFSGLSAAYVQINAPAAHILAPWLLLAAFFLLITDTLAELWFNGGAFGVRKQSALLLAFFIIIGSTSSLSSPFRYMAPFALNAYAQQEKRAPKDMESALKTRLAYIITGDPRTDEASEAGLLGLSQTLANRTSLTPGAPIGVDPARDELAFYPLLYWPIAPNQPLPSEETARKISAYMKQGGTIIFDTRDAAAAGAPPSAASLWMRKFLEHVDAPELEPLPPDHVATKAFYLLDGFVGRSAAGQTWVEASPPDSGETGFRPARLGDSVSPLIIVSNDLAAAWAVDSNGEPLYPMESGGSRQRELSLRGGVNLVLYTLTGNYKADQIHVRDLLNRLGH